MRLATPILLLLFAGCTPAFQPAERPAPTGPLGLGIMPEDDTFVPASLTVRLQEPPYAAQALPAAWDTATLYLTHPATLTQPRTATLVKNVTLMANGQGGYAASGAFGLLRPTSGYTLTVSLWYGGAFTTLAGERQVSFSLVGGNNAITVPIQVYPALSLTGFTPTSAAEDTLISLSGTGFSVLGHQDTIRLGTTGVAAGTAASVSLTVTTPDVAPDAYPWEVQVGTQVVSRAGFTMTGTRGAKTSLVTTADQQHNPAIAYGPGEYLVVWNDDRVRGADDIYGRRVARDGTGLGADFVVLEGAPTYEQPELAYSPAANRYLAVFHDSSNGGDVRGQLVSGAGVPYGASIPLATLSGDQDEARVCHEATRARFMVLYRYGTQLHACPVSVEGVVGSTIPVSTTGDSKASAALAYSAVSDRYLIVWSNDGAGDARIRGTLMRPDGSFEVDAFDISTDHSFFQMEPRVEVEPTTGDFLVVWIDRRSPYQVCGRRISSTGALLGSEIVISNASGNKFVPRLAYEAARQKFIVAWMDRRHGDDDLYGRYVGIDGTLWGSDFPIAITSEDETPCAVAADPELRRGFVAFEGHLNAGNIYLQQVR